jgi:hypothetical protein
VENSRDLVSDRDSPPSGSTSVFERHADGVTITIPPTGMQNFLGDRSNFLVLFIAGALIAWIAVGSARAVAQNGPSAVLTFDGACIAWPGALILAASIACTLRRSGRLVVGRGVLIVQWTHLIITRERTWQHHELVEVRAVSQCVKSDGTMEWSQSLIIRSRDPKAPATGRLFEWLSKAELEWISTTIRRVLRLPSDDSSRTHSCFRVRSRGTVRRNFRKVLR